MQHRDGRITWTTPTGHTYTSNPYDYRVDDEPEVLPRDRPPRTADDAPPF